jgi:hypothetical protein
MVRLKRTLEFSLFSVLLASARLNSTTTTAVGSGGGIICQSAAKTKTINLFLFFKQMKL